MANGLVLTLASPNHQKAEGLFNTDSDLIPSPSPSLSTSEPEPNIGLIGITLSNQINSFIITAKECAIFESEMKFYLQRGKFNFNSVIVEASMRSCMNSLPLWSISLDVYLHLVSHFHAPQ